MCTGVTTLGTFELDDTLTCFPDPPHEGIVREDFHDAVFIDTAPGTWTITLHDVPAEVPGALRRAIEAIVPGVEARDELLETLADIGFERRWLVFSHADAAGPCPTPPLDDADALAKRLVGSHDPADTLWSLVDGLIEYGVCQVEGGQIGVLVGDALTDDQAAAMRFASDPQAAVWAWGLLYRTGGDGGFGVYAKGENGPHRYVAIGV